MAALPLAASGERSADRLPTTFRQGVTWGVRGKVQKDEIQEIQGAKAPPYPPALPPAEPPVTKAQLCVIGRPRRSPTAMPRSSQARPR